MAVNNQHQEPVLPPVCCGRCKFSKAVQFGGPIVDVRNGSQLECCRYPGEVFTAGAQVVTMQPIKAPHQWCGEFQPVIARETPSESGGAAS